MKDRIRDETRAEISAKAAEDKTKLTEKLDAQVAAKKLTAAERKDRLSQHDELWQSKTENVIAQKIERAHIYSFNLSNYRSSLAPELLAAWKDFAATYVREDDPSKTLEKQYRAIAAAAPYELDELISGLDPRHTLELDIARQFLTGISPNLFTKHPHLRTLQEIIRSTEKAQHVQLKSILKHFIRPVRLEPEVTYRLVTVRLYGKGVQLRSETQGAEIKGANWFRVETGDLIMSKIDARNGAFGIIPCDLDGAIVTNEFPVFRVSSPEWVVDFLLSLLTRPHFYQRFDAMVSGASGRRRVEPAEFLDMEIPDAPPTLQREVGTRIVELRQAIAVASSELEALEEKVNGLMEN